jgi:hypothetical protein
MLSLLVAAAVAAQQPPAAALVDPDVRCMAAFLFAVGQMTDDPKASAEDKNAATTMVMYFFGKVRGRMPDLDVKAQIKPMVEAPSYLPLELPRDIQRCGAEYELRGKELGAFGEN